MTTFKEETEKEIIRYLRSTKTSDDVQKMHLCGTGAVYELEYKLKKHYKKEYALCVSNATTGLMALALALKLKSAEFITTPYTYGATVSGWLLVGNKPKFADIESSTLTLDHESVRRIITPKTRAILVSDIYGNPHDTAGLRKLADEYDLWYISDSAQSLGAYRDGLPAGAFADALVVSFTVGKTVFAGEGAAILTSNQELYQKLIWLTQHPQRQKRELGLNLTNEFALNARIHPLAAIWANASFMASLQKLKKHQKECFSLIKTLNEIGLTEKINFKSGRIKPSFLKFTASWKNKKRSKDALLKELQERGLCFQIGTAPVRLLYKQSAFISQYPRFIRSPYDCPRAEQQTAIRFSLHKDRTFLSSRTSVT